MSAPRRPRGSTGGVHACPGCNRLGIPNRLYACRDCWGRLPRHIQRQITSTVRATPGERVVALQAAADFYASEELR